jgi:DNA-binding NtrC family response regulator
MSSRGFALHEGVSAFKRTLVLEALAANGGNRSRAALALKIERTSLLRLIRELGLSHSLPNGQRGRPRSTLKPYGPAKNGSPANVS